MATKPKAKTASATRAAAGAGDGDAAGAFVTEDARRRDRKGAVPHRDVGVANAAGGPLDVDLTRPRGVERDLFDWHGLFVFEEKCCFHGPVS